jgi:carbonic anhydrase
MGHSRCGAIKGACDHVEMGNLTELLAKIQPAVYEETDTTNRDQRNSANEVFVENVAGLNVKRSVKAIVERSFILEQMIAKGEIGIIGAKHDLESGAVEFYPETMLSSLADVKSKLVK